MSKRKQINVRGINSEISNDPFYRYKMEEVVISQQKNKICFENIDKVCKDLDRNVKLLIGFLKKYFNTSIEYKNNQMFTTKIISKNEMQDAIYNFIEKYILCEKCKNPETIYDESKKSTFMICKACSHKRII